MRPSPTPVSRSFLRRAALALLAVASVASSGCVYRMAIQQGNYLDPEQISQLEAGMTRSQVMFLLGTPMVPTAFDNDRWDYYYFLKYKRLEKPLTSRLTVFFENDKVSRIDKSEGLDKKPPATEPDRALAPDASAAT